MSSYSPTHTLSALTLFSLSYFCIPFGAAICYYPDEGLSPQDVPCSDSEEESNCCGPGYACLSNKVCRMAHEDGDGNHPKYTYGRGSCTDKKWRSSACPSFCILGSSRIVNCDPTQKVESSYCCAAINGTLTQDGVNGICDCGADEGLTKPLHFEGEASAVTTIDAVSLSQSLLPSTHVAASSSQSSLLILDVIASSSQDSLPTTTALKTTSSSVHSLQFEGKTSAISSIDVIASSSQSLLPTLTALTKTSSSIQGFSSVSAAPALTTEVGSITSFSTSTIPPSPTASLSLSSSSQISNKRAVAVGASVGTPLALIILGLAAFLLYRKISHSSQETSISSDSFSSDFDPSVPPSPYHQSVGEHEVSASTEEHEMQAEPGRYETREFLYRRRASDSVSTLSEEGGITTYVHTNDGCSEKPAPQTTESL